MENYKITVEVKEHDDGLAEFVITTPEDQERIDVLTTSLILAGAIGMIIKICSKSNMGIKDHKLLKIVIDTIEDHFSSTSSFEDAAHLSRKNEKNKD